jgi:hypothetical protein
VGAWSGEAQLWVRGQGVGDFVELAVPAPGPEARRLFLYATRSWDYGVLRFTVNGEPAGPDHDLYCERVEPAGPFELGVFEPVDGRWVLRAEVVGANPESRAPQAYFGLDCVVARLPDEPRSFAEQAAFIGAHTDLVTLTDATGQAIVTVAPEWQGRVMTTTMAGPDGPSCGYVHRERILSGEVQPHMNVFGGEDRLWLGPEAGQFGLYFAPGDPFDLEHWQTPAAIDTEPWEVVAQDAREVTMRHRAQLVNHSGTPFDVGMERSVRLLDPAALAAQLGAALPEGLETVAYESENILTNAGDEPWLEETGLISLWIMGMFPPGPGVTVVIPVVAGPESELGPMVNDSYFGAIPSDYLRVDAERALVFLRANGQRRGKIGIPPRRASPVAGSWDPGSGVLTLVGYDKPEGVTGYVNSEWRIQEEPYGGDVVNSYNDGPPAPGAKPLGPFYEIETSSPGAALDPGASMTHVQRTMHLSGDRAALDAVAREVLGVSLDEIEAVFPSGG